MTCVLNAGEIKIIEFISVFHSSDAINPLVRERHKLLSFSYLSSKVATIFYFASVAITFLPFQFIVGGSNLDICAKLREPHIQVSRHKKTAPI